MYKGHKIGVVVLAYNVEKFIVSTVEELPNFVDKVYVIDDGSVDKTAEVVRNLGYPQVILIEHGKNKGPGAGLKTGYQAALSDDIDITVKVDGDGQMPVEYMEPLIDPIVLGKADYTKGDRLSRVENRKGMPRFRLFGNLILTWLNRIASGYWNINDPQNGYTAISKSALNIVNSNNIYAYYGYLNDILVQLNIHHFKVIDVQMPSKYGEEKSSIKLRKYIPKLSAFLLRRFLFRLKRKYIMPVFKR